MATATPEARAMLLKILEFGELRVDDVMVSRADIIAISEKAKLNEALLMFADATHSRLPVYRETLDEPVGMLHIKDLLQWLISRGMAGQPLPQRTEDGDISAIIQAAPQLSLAAVPLDIEIAATGCIRDVLFVPPSMPAADLLVRMQATRSHMALVVDEYGGIAGLVTIEDIVEEIVGDIDDEHDEEEPMIRQEPDGTYVADARAAIEDVEGVLQVDLLPDEEDEDVDTLSGLLFSLVRRVPARGETVTHPSGITFEVLDSDPRRLKTIRIIPGPERPSPGNGNGSSGYLTQ
ncbi:hemolysin family protein [Rhodoligotrophos defluvii]|uniref:hemolysin family protein n=1 Tax=Rhodoligotrophos defluvii TaxID=2561934 RepID=UPI001EF0D628|nr:hemolysin family protein [Rhodoligotrophos defluvii]